jgi:hypothetical protein
MRQTWWCSISVATSPTLRTLPLSIASSPTSWSLADDKEQHHENRVFKYFTRVPPSRIRSCRCYQHCSLLRSGYSGDIRRCPTRRLGVLEGSSERHTGRSWFLHREMYITRTNSSMRRECLVNENVIYMKGYRKCRIIRLTKYTWTIWEYMCRVSRDWGHVWESEMEEDPVQRGP